MSNNTYPSQSQHSQHPSHAYTGHFQQDLDRLTRLTLNTDTNNATLTSNQTRTQSTQHTSANGCTQHKQPTPWPPSPPQEPCMTLPGTFPTSLIQPARSIYKPLLAASPTSFDPESTVVSSRQNQRHREDLLRWEQYQDRFLQHVPPPVSMDGGVDVSEWAERGPYSERQGSRCSKRVPTPGPGSPSASAIRRLTPVFATGVPDPPPSNGPDESRARERIGSAKRTGSLEEDEKSGKTNEKQGQEKEMVNEEDVQKPGKRITVRRDSVEENERAKKKENREEVWVGINVRVKRGTGRCERERLLQQQSRESESAAGEEDDEWEVVKRPGGVVVDDGVDSDDSNTWY